MPFQTSRSSSNTFKAVHPIDRYYSGFFGFGTYTSAMKKVE